MIFQADNLGAISEWLCVTGLTEVTVLAYLAAMMSMSGLIFQIHLTFIPSLLPLLSHISPGHGCALLLTRQSEKDEILTPSSAHSEI